MVTFILHTNIKEMIPLTIYDISKQAGVSIATVSRVLNGSANVKPKTRKKVMDVMDLWRGRSWNHLDATQVEKIQAILDERDNLERLYGSSEKRTQEAVSNLIKLIMG